MIKNTICSKHEKIISLAQDIISLAEEAIDDGKSMEDALHERKKEVAFLEERIKGLQNALL